MLDQAQTEPEAPVSGYQDIQLQCIDCPETFTFTKGEQEFFTKNNYVQPKRCPACRAAKKRRMASRDGKQFDRRPRNDQQPY